MRSGDPTPIDELKLIIESKQAAPSVTVDVVSDAARWLKSALKGAGVKFSYASCEEQNHYGYAAFTVLRSFNGEPLSLDMKVAEIRGMPHIFAEVRSLGKFDGTMFPFFGDLRSDDDRDLFLHYIADFLISTDA